MADKSITMDFDTEGRVTIQAHGYEGGSCIDATAPFEDIFMNTEKPREAVGECATSGTDMGERVL